MERTSRDASSKSKGLTAHVTETFYERWYERARQERKSAGELSREVLEAYLEGETQNALADVMKELRLLRATVMIGLLYPRPMTEEQVAHVVEDAAHLESTGELLPPENLNQ